MRREPEQTTARSRHPIGAGPGQPPSSLLRSAHIFSSVVREVLEVRLLAEASPLPLSLSQLHLLRLMSNNGRHQLNDLAHFLGISPTAATKNVDKLEGFGLVVRARAADDRRAAQVSVSDEGARLVRRYEELKRERLRPVLEGFGDEELALLARLLERFAVALLAGVPDEDHGCLRCAAYVERSCSVGLARGGCPYRNARAARLRSRALPGPRQRSSPSAPGTRRSARRNPS